MAMVSFKRGLHQNLPSTAVDGVFYLTTDTNRLYVGNADGNFVDLNKYIKNVASIEEAMALPNKKKDDFVYISGGNIFAVYNGENWVQVNTNTNDDTSVSDLAAATERVTEEDGKKVKITLTLSQSKVGVDGLPYPEENQPEDITTSFYITQEDFSALVEGAAIDVTTEEVEGGVKIKTVGTGSAGDGFELVAGTNVVIAKNADSDKVTVSAKDTTYTISSDKENNAIQFKNNADVNDVQSVKFVNGDLLTATVDENGVKYSHNEIETGSSTGTAVSAAGSKVNVVTALSNDGYGHVTNVETTEVTLPSYSLSGGYDSESKELTITLTDNNDPNNNKTVDLSDSVFYKVGTEESSVVYKNGEILPVYTMEEVDSKLANLASTVNGVNYKGTVTEESALPTIDSDPGVSIGDMYMITVDNVPFGSDTVEVLGVNGEKDSIVSKAGDLLIALGDENAEGKIVSNLRWTYVPAGNETDTTYDLSVETSSLDKVSVKLSNNIDTNDVQEFNLVAGKQIGVSVSGSDITIKHADIESKENPTVGEAVSLSKDNKVTVVTGIAKTDNGHVTEITTQEISINSNVDTTYALSADSATNSIVLSNNLDVNEKDSVAFKVGSTNESLSVTVDSNNGITYSHADYTAVESESTSAVEADNTIKVIDSITTENGHVTGYNVNTITLPEADTYSLAGKVEASTPAEGSAKTGVSITTTMLGTTGADKTNSYTSSFDLESESLNVAIAGSKVSMELEWGSFNS